MSPADIREVDGALQTEDRIISSLITREQGKGTVELLDLGNLFPGNAVELAKIGESLQNDVKDTRERRYHRYVVFAFAGQLYGVPVEYTQEITFFAALNQMYRGGVEDKNPRFSSSIQDLYKHSDIDGSLTLRGNVILLNMDQLLDGHADELKALTRLSNGAGTTKAREKEPVAGAHHLITENCYLVFSIGKHMAVQLKDVQEIIERVGVLDLPGMGGFTSGVINLRGLVVPVISLREFYGYKGAAPGADTGAEPRREEQKLIICRTESRTVALEVDAIVTIYKQEQFQNTTSLKKKV